MEQSINKMHFAQKNPNLKEQEEKPLKKLKYKIWFQ